MIKTFSAGMVFAGAFMLSASASANDVQLRFGDLDLGSEAGRIELQARIARTAQALCAGQVQTGTILGRQNQSHCRAETRARLAEQVTRRTGTSAFGG